MIKLLKVTFWISMIGWFPFMWVCAWGSHQSDTVRVSVVLAGIGICLFCSIMMLAGNQVLDRGLQGSEVLAEKERIAYEKSRRLDLLIEALKRIALEKSGISAEQINAKADELDKGRWRP